MVDTTRTKVVLSKRTYRNRHHHDHHMDNKDDDLKYISILGKNIKNRLMIKAPSTIASFGMNIIMLIISIIPLCGLLSFVQPILPAVAETTTTTTTTAATTTTQPPPTSTSTGVSKRYDGFAEYAKENQMEQSDVGCFIQQCGKETKALFSNPRGIQGVSCLGRCKGEQSCATRCFAQYGSAALNDWLSCTIEEHDCVKVPKKNVDNSAEDIGYPYAVSNFNPKSLTGTWYKTNGLNPNYDLFDCQTNTFTMVTDDNNNNNNNNENNPTSQLLDMDIFFRVQRPEESGGGYWENALTERMIVDDGKSTKTSLSAAAAASSPSPPQRTLHTEGKMYGLQFSENWYILGQSDGNNNNNNNDNIPPFVLVAYKGHTLQGNYEGAFVYAREPTLPLAAIPAVKEAAHRGGLNWDDFTTIDNTCPISSSSGTTTSSSSSSTKGGGALNDSTAGTGTSFIDWMNLIVGEGGVIDWIFPGWRGEYK